MKYGKGPDSELQISEHTIVFAMEEENIWVGKSLPQKDGSEVTLTLKQSGNDFQGEWKERTSPTGSYSGREFGGIVLLVLQTENELSGMWLGKSSSTNQVKDGPWAFTKEIE